MGEFALQIHGLNPDAGEPEGTGESSIEPSRVTQIFHQTFYGDTAFAAAGHTVNQRADLSKTTIEETLNAFGIDEGDRQTLLVALDEEGVLEGNPPGEETRRWLERLEQGAIAVGAGVTTQTAAAALGALLGLN